MGGVTTLNGARGAEGSKRGELWDDNTQTYFRERRGERKEEGGRDVVRPGQLSLALVDIHPSGPSPCSHAPGAVREEGGGGGRTEVKEWMEMDGDGGGG